MYVERDMSVDALKMLITLKFPDLDVSKHKVLVGKSGFEMNDKNGECVTDYNLKDYDRIWILDISGIQMYVW